MPHLIEPSILRIINAKGETIGTGFLVSETLAVTCAHVVLAASIDSENRIRIQFTSERKPVFATILDKYFDVDRDVAILQVDKVPAFITSLRLGRASESRLKNDLYTFGYAIAAGEQGIGGLGTFIRQDGNFVQFRMHEADHGHSGAPLYDDKRGVVVGMVKKGKDTPGRNAETTYAISTETIWKVCPQLTPPPPPSRDPIVEGINLLPYDYDQRIQNFLVEYLGSEKQRVPFGGRDDALRILDDWLTTSTPYLLLAAPAGRGKSALLVRWLDSLRAREDLALAFVPVSIRFGVNMERVFYTALAARLAYLHGDDVPSSSETSTAVYRGLVNDYLSKSLPDGRILLVVLDGLDEAADWQAGADFLPSVPPARVRVAVSMRFLAGDADSTAWLRRLNWDKGQAIALHLSPLTHSGVRDVLFKMGCPLDELSRDVDIVTELYRLSEGDALLVGLYVGDLWAQGEKVIRLKPKDLADIQPGYSGYFERWWKDQKKLWGKKKPWLQRYIYTLQNFLAGALGPLFISDIQTLAPKLTSRHIADALDILGRFIIGDNQLQGYTFSHPKLGQYFWESLTPSEQEQIGTHFLNWCGQTLQDWIAGRRNPKKKADVPSYIVHNYSAHLVRAERSIEDWLQLIHYYAWAQAWFTVEGAYGGYLQDVQRIWDLCKVLDRQAIAVGQSATYLDLQVHCALIETSLHSLAANIPAELIPILVQRGSWTLPQAWVSIRQMPDSERKYVAITNLIAYLDHSQLLEALATAREIRDPLPRSSVLRALAKYLPESDLGQVLTITQEMDDVHSRAEVLSALVLRLPEVADEALTAAREIKNARDRAEVLSTLVLGLSEVADEALTAARKIKDTRDRAKVLGALAQRLPETELGKVLSAAREIVDAGSRAEVLSTLALRLPEVAEEALTATREIKDAWSRAKVLSAFPEAANEALAAAREIEYAGSRAEVLNALASHLPEVADEALTAAREIKDERSRAEVLGALAWHLPEVADEALTVAREIRDTWVRAKVLRNLTLRLPETELEMVLYAAREIENAGFRAEVLSTLARRLPEVADEALTAAREIGDTWSRAKVLSALVQRLPETKLGQVLSAAREILSEESRSEVLSALAQRLPETELGQVLTAAREIGDTQSRAEVLSVLARRLPEAVDETLTAAREIKDAWPRAKVLSTLVWHLPEVADEALAIVQGIENESYRAILLSDLVQCLPESDLGGVLTAVQEIGGAESNAEALIALAQRLPEAKLCQVLNAAQKIDNARTRARILCALAQRLPKTELGQVLIAAQEMDNVRDRAELLSALAQRLPEVVDEALAAAREIGDANNRAKMLGTLTQLLPEVAEEALAAVWKIDNVWSRASVLSTLAPHLPEKELEQVLTAARGMGDVWCRASVLSILAQRLPEVVGEALTTAGEIRDTNSRTILLNELAQTFIPISKKKYYQHIELILSQLAFRKRNDFASDLSALLPILLYLGEEGLAQNILQSMCDVSLWWP